MCFLLPKLSISMGISWPCHCNRWMVHAMSCPKVVWALLRASCGAARRTKRDEVTKWDKKKLFLTYSNPPTHIQKIEKKSCLSILVGYDLSLSFEAQIHQASFTSCIPIVGCIAITRMAMNLLARHQNIAIEAMAQSKVR